MGDMRVLHICSSDSRGGAAIAAHRLASAQRAAGIEASMLVLHKDTADAWVSEAVAPAIRQRVRAARFVAKRFAAALASERPDAMRTLAMLPTGLGREAARGEADIVHWHWVGAEAVSLREMSALSGPAVWTCHDEWAFCGAEHYAADLDYARGYADRAWLDVDRLTFARKQAAWAGWRPTLVCPSAWMAERARASRLLADSPVETIPNTLDFACFRPHGRAAAQRELRLPEQGKIVLFGADNGATDPRKGFDLLVEAIAAMSAHERKSLHMVTFGGEPGAGELCGVPLTALGALREESKLALAYSAADVFVAPSRQDNLPNTLIEAQACGTPCAGFAVGGLPDIVAAPHHGRLAPPLDARALAEAILGCAESPADREAIRADAQSRFGPAPVVERHRQVYERMLGRGCGQ